MSSTSIYYRVSGNHTDASTAAHRRLSIPQEQALLAKINEYASRGTLLSPHHVKELAEAVCGAKAGKNWTTSFLRRYHDVIDSRYYGHKERPRFHHSKVPGVPKSRGDEYGPLTATGPKICGLGDHCVAPPNSGSSVAGAIM